MLSIRLLPLIIFICFIFSSLHAQSSGRKPGKRAAPDTLVFVFCSSMPIDINTQATYELALEELKKVEDVHLVIERDSLLGDNFTPNALTQVVNRLSNRRKNVRVLFHFFDHGKNIGDKIPGIVSSHIIPEDGQSGAINLRKTVLEPLIGKLDFVMVLADACNAIEIGPIPPEKSPGPEMFTVADANETVQNSAKAARVVLEETKSSKLRKPFGLLRSNKGWVAISTAGPEQKAAYSKSVGGYGSRIFFNMQVESFEAQKNWVKFFDTYRSRLEGVKPNGRLQSPVWVGVINGRDISEDSLLYPYRPISTERVNALLKKQRSKIKKEDLVPMAQIAVDDFCDLLNATRNGPVLPKELTRLALSANDVPVFDDISALREQNSNTGYIALSRYRSQRNPDRSEYLLDSLEYVREWEKEPRKDKIYISFNAVKRLTVRGPDGVQIDTNVHQIIFLEVQTEIRPLQKFVRKVGRKVKDFFTFRKSESSDEAPILISHVYNVPGKIQPSRDRVNPPPHPHPHPPPPAIIPAEDFFVPNADSLLRAYFGLIERAANHKDLPQEKVLLELQDYFQQANKDTVEVSNHNGKLERMTAEEYFTRFWTKFDGLYDSVYYQFEELVLPTPGSEGYLKKMDENNWMSRVTFKQLFQGYQNGKILYDDVTSKTVEMWLIKDTGMPDPSRPYRIEFRSIKVNKTEKAPHGQRKKNNIKRNPQP